MFNSWSDSPLLAYVLQTLQHIDAQVTNSKLQQTVSKPQFTKLHNSYNNSDTVGVGEGSLSLRSGSQTRAIPRLVLSKADLNIVAAGQKPPKCPQKNSKMTAFQETPNIFYFLNVICYSVDTSEHPYPANMPRIQNIMEVASDFQHAFNMDFGLKSTVA